MKAAKKVIILDNIDSPQIAQAIFILNDAIGDEFSAVIEAERIIDDYLGGMPLSKFSGNRFFKKPLFWFLLSGALISALCCVFSFCV